MNSVYHTYFESQIKTEIDETKSDVFHSEVRSTVARGFLFKETYTLILLFKSFDSQAWQLLHDLHGKTFFGLCNVKMMEFVGPSLDSFAVCFSSQSSRSSSTGQRNVLGFEALGQTRHDSNLRASGV